LGFGVALDTRKRRNVDAAEELLFALGMCAYAFAQGGLLACGEGESVAISCVVGVQRFVLMQDFFHFAKIAFALS